MLKNGAKGLNSSKWLLLACAVSAAVVDIIIIAMLIAGGEAGEYLACPFLLLIFDLFYFAVSLFFTNFRFKYSIGVWVSYIILYTIGFSIGLAIILGGDGTVVTNGALALWACVHAFNIVCAAVCALFASRVIRNGWFALAVAAIFIVGAAVYAGFTVSDGFFGQGKGKRTLVYSYDSSKGQYTVTGVLAGKSNTVSVPETFNGKPVTAVSFKVFAEKGVKEYHLPDNVDFTGESALSRDMKLKDRQIRINVGKKSVNDFRQKFLDRAETVRYRENAVALANATLPVNLAENEGYVAFNYDADGFKTVEGNTIPVYVGELDKFDFSTHTAGFDYVAHREDGSADNYYWAYNNGGYILSDIGVSDSVPESTVADMKFERVYRIKVDDGNDKKYPMREKQPELCFDNVGGTTDYKYLTKPKASIYLNGLTERKGFTYRWIYYKTTPAQGIKVFTDLTEVLEKEQDDITISTDWVLKNPTVSVSTSAPNNTITYGDDVTLLSDVRHEADGISVRYQWFFENEEQYRWSTDSVSFTHPKPSERNGAYKLRVIVGSDEITALGAAAEANVNLKINRKKVTFDWQLPENTVYDGTIKTVSVSLAEDQQVEGDPVNYTVTGLKSFKDAGIYAIGMSYDVITGMNYELVNPSNCVIISPCPVEVDWANYENLEYNGSTQCPTASAMGIPADGELFVKVSGGSRNAGTYTATATTSDKNYSLTGATRVYTIAKKPLTIKSKGAIVAYGKVDPKPVSSTWYDCDGFVEGDGVASLSGTAMVSYEYKDVGTYEGGVRIWGLTSNNYEINYVNGTLTIGCRAIELEWLGADNLVYDGTPKSITAVAVNKGYEDDDIRVIITGGDAIYAGEHTAVPAIDPDCASANNYSFTFSPPGTTQFTYTIQKRTATVVWNVPQNPVYDGAEHNVTYSVQNLASGDKQHFADSFKYCDAGDYSFEVAGDQFVRANYNLNNVSVSFKVKPAQGSAEFFVNNIPYDDYDTTVRVGDKISWLGNSHIWSVVIYCNGEVVYMPVSSMVFIYQDYGEYEIKAAGNYVFETEVGGNDDNTIRRTVTFKISGVLERGEV